MTPSAPAGSGEVSAPPATDEPQIADAGRPDRERFPWRAFLIGILFVPVCVYWIEYTEIITHAADLAAMSLIISVVAFLLLLIAVNQAVRHFSIKHALTQSELLLVYAINATTVGISGIGIMQFLVTELPAPFYYATPSNHWDNWKHYLRSWAFPDKSVVAAFYKGRSSLFVEGHFAGWVTPIIVWSVFLFVLIFTFYCIATLLRRQWVERERLLFPIVVIPLEITQNGGAAPIFRNKLFWLGCGLAVLLEVLATLHYTISPGIPYIPIKPNENLFNIGQYVTSVPWNGIGTLQLAIYPMVIGLAYLLSLDVSFSVWFFYMFGKLENVAAVALGFKDPGAPPAVSRIPYPNQQCAGAFTGLALISLCFALPHFKRAWQHAFYPGEGADASKYTDKYEPMSYRAAYIGVIAGVMFLVAFAIALGMSLGVALMFVGLYLLWGITMTRIRAEAGLPWGGGPGDYVHGNIVQTGGVQNFTTQEMTAMVTLHWMDSDFRTLEMQQQLEVMKIADDGTSGARLINARHMTVCILIAVVVAIAASWLSLLTIYYRHGAASADIDLWRTQMGQWTFDQMNTWANNPLPFDQDAMKWTVGGALFTVFLSVMRTRFVWWPFHPIGYAVSLTGIDWIWFPIFVGWVIKRIILRYGGLQMYRQALPFFIGLVIGDYAISSILALLYSILGQSGYRTFPI
jgi:hypothetical protein